METMGVPPALFTRACVVVDKLDKIGKDAVRDQLVELGVDLDVSDQLFTVLDVGDLPSLRAILGDASPAVEELEQLFGYAEAYGISEWVELDLSVVRGLAYYTGVVFEGFDRAGELRAIFGGGRYDALLETFGGESMPAVGFGFGDAVIVELLKERGVLPDFEQGRRGVDAVIFPMSPELRPEAVRAASALRDAGRRVDLILEGKKAKWVFKHADRIGASYVVVIGKREADNGIAAVKDLATSEQREVSLEDLPSAIPAGHRK